MTRLTTRPSSHREVPPCGGGPRPYPQPVLTIVTTADADANRRPLCSPVICMIQPHFPLPRQYAPNGQASSWTAPPEGSDRPLARCFPMLNACCTRTGARPSRRPRLRVLDARGPGATGAFDKELDAKTKMTRGSATTLD